MLGRHILNSKSPSLAAIKTYFLLSPKARMHTLRQQLGSVQAILESLVHQQCTVTSQINSLQKQKEVVVNKNCSTCCRPLSRTQIICFPSQKCNFVASSCWSEPRRVTDGKLPIKMVFHCYGRAQDDNDSLMFLQKCFTSSL